MSRLDAEKKKELLRIMLTSRLGDLREQSLIRQGKGWFHVSGMGHEALAAVGRLLREGDYFAGYYRDRPIALGRGMSNFDLALAFFAKRSSPSGGRQMPAHYSDREKGIFSVASVVAASLLPACGLAWGVKLDRKPNVVVATVGDASTRQGDFYEAVAFAKERQLPIVVLVEDNGIGISTPTDGIHPLALGVLDARDWQTIDACDVETVHAAAAEAMEAARTGGGPRFLWCRTERISSHSSADDHRKYRPEKELAALAAKDPVERFKQLLLAEGVYSEKEYDALHAEVEEAVRRDFARAWEELDPDPADNLDHVLGPSTPAPSLQLPLEEKARMVDAINGVFHAALGSSRDFIFFGQDIEDPKGGVFSLTKGLSSAYPENVYNSPLAESTIIGVAAGLAAYGKRPVFEIQFTDFLWAGFNQLLTNLSTLHWRTSGEWSAPAVIYAPYGAYLPGGALWHSQANEAALAHFPGLQIAIPSTPEDIAGLFWSAMHGQSPTVVLIPKHLMWHPQTLREAPAPVPFGKARRVQEGEDLTIVAWGNCLELVQHALAEEDLGEGVVELIDPRTIVPLDLAAIKASVRKTGRLLVVHEDAESCSVGQKIIAQVVGDRELFGALAAEPVLLAKPDVNVGYHPDLEYAMLPSQGEVRRLVRQLLAARLERGTRAMPRNPVDLPTPNMAREKFRESFSEGVETSSVREIRVPLLGEGIASAKVISLVAKPGDEISEGDTLCELETDKALFPVEAPFGGTLKQWLIAEDEEVEVEQRMVELEVEAVEGSSPRRVAVPEAEGRRAPVQVRPTEGGLSPYIVAQMRNVVPAHMTVKA
ncbi:MAG: thiamine pyrophosphate-dependent enzyme, partial [Verrucomicrobiota bacterium]